MKKTFESFTPCLELREVVFLRTLPPHNHLVPALDIFLDPFSKKLHICMEHMEGNLYQLMKARDHKCLDNASVKSILFQIMQACSTSTPTASSTATSSPRTSSSPPRATRRPPTRSAATRPSSRRPRRRRPTRSRSPTLASPARPTPSCPTPRTSRPAGTAPPRSSCAPANILPRSTSGPWAPWPSRSPP